MCSHAWPRNVVGVPAQRVEAWAVTTTLRQGEWTPLKLFQPSISPVVVDFLRRLDSETVVHPDHAEIKRPMPGPIQRHNGIRRQLRQIEAVRQVVDEPAVRTKTHFDHPSTPVSVSSTCTVVIVDVRRNCPILACFLRTSSTAPGPWPRHQCPTRTRPSSKPPSLKARSRRETATCARGCSPPR